MKKHTTKQEISLDEYASLKAAISNSDKQKLKAICAVKGIKMQDVLAEIIVEYINKNKHAIGE